MFFVEVGCCYLCDRFMVFYVCKVIESKRDEFDFDEFVIEFEDLVMLKCDLLF